MTRAKDRLCISWAAKFDGRSKHLSRFLAALPAELMTWHNWNHTMRDKEVYT